MAAPPAWDTLHSGPPDPPPQLPNTMSPFRFHAPDRFAPLGRLATVSGGPPVVSTLLTLLSTVMKPTYRLSGDQKGVTAPSVPGRRLHSTVSKSRSHNPSCAVAANTSLRPSGDTDRSSYGVTFSGTGVSNRLSELGAAGRNIQTPIASAIVAISAATPCHTRTDRAGIDDGGESAAIHFRACLTSRADCHRFSGSFSRQVLTTSARPRGVRGCISSSGRGSSLRIDATRAACVLPVNGRVPAINS